MHVSRHSARQCSPLLGVETLFESELFGHVRGSFTASDSGQASQAYLNPPTKGQIFLDEIRDMPVGTQAKLLRTLQNQEVLRVGALTPRNVGVPVIGATPLCSARKPQPFSGCGVLSAREEAAVRDTIGAGDWEFLHFIRCQTIHGVHIGFHRSWG